MLKSKTFVRVVLDVVVGPVLSLFSGIRFVLVRPLWSFLQMLFFFWARVSPEVGPNKQTLNRTFKEEWIDEMETNERWFVVSIDVNWISSCFSNSTFQLSRENRGWKILGAKSSTFTRVLLARVKLFLSNRTSASKIPKNCPAAHDSDLKTCYPFFVLSMNW